MSRPLNFPENSGLCNDGSVTVMLKAFLSSLRRRTWYHQASRAEADAQLRSHEGACEVAEGAIARIDVAHLPANRPTEDHFSVAKCLASEAFLFGVFDGHGGASCSRFVSTHLFEYLSACVLKKHLVSDLPLAKRLQWFFTNSDIKDEIHREKHWKHVEDFYNNVCEDANLTTIRGALEAAFCACDNNMSTDALSGTHGTSPREYVSLVTSGSCGVVAHIKDSHLHVANVGDSMAILGVESQEGVIKHLPVSKPHCVDNADEIRRIHDEHPPTEGTTILVGGRLFGELFPLRAFGDVRYKWSAELQKVVLGRLNDYVPRGLHTPPYLTALPEVLYHRLNPTDRFLVLASDGLWDCLDPDTVVRLVYDHMLGTETLTSYNPYPGTTLAQVYDDLKQRQSKQSKKPLDENSATHLLRHALGGCSGGLATQYRRLIEMLQLPAGVARTYRDDITIIIVHFDKQYLEQFHHDRTTQG